MGRLKVALMGLSGVGADYLAAIRSDERFDLLAVADSDPETARRHAEGSTTRAYGDYRSLIVETTRDGQDLLFVALEPFQSAGFMEMAATQRIGVFHKSPFARNATEAQHLVGCFADHGCPLVVSRWWQFEPAFQPLLNLTERVGQVHAATAEVRTADTPAGWRGEWARAGGGVLLNGAYDTLDMLIHLLGLPETVYARCASALAPGASRNYDTEDVAIMSLGFSRDRTASLIAWRGSPEQNWRATLLSTDQTVELCPDGLTIRHHGGGPAEHHAARAPNSARAAIGAFVESRLSGVHKFASAAHDHLATMAVIEAAYLAAKTGAPESPRRFLS
jgi:predicted dehydrogenase